jgi:hypothetical protein
MAGVIMAIPPSASGSVSMQQGAPTFNSKRQTIYN